MTPTRPCSPVWSRCFHQERAQRNVMACWLAQVWKRSHIRIPVLPAGETCGKPLKMAAATWWRRPSRTSVGLDGSLLRPSPPMSATAVDGSDGRAAGRQCRRRHAHHYPEETAAREQSKTPTGNEIIESRFRPVPPVCYFWGRAVGMRLVRAIQVTQVGRDTAQMRTRFVRSPRVGSQDLVVRIATCLA